MTTVAPSPQPAAEAPKPPVPAEFPPPVKATLDWLNARFCSWYAANPPPLPDRFTRREFGYIPWPTKPGPPPFVRHLAFQSADVFHQSLARAGPHSVYYSTAYYRRPSDLKMVDKQWLGAELIFDLDADHLEDVEKAKAEGRELPLDEQLRQVKVKFKTLLDEFLFGDFGLSDKDVWITFSGGRGYHAHVVEDRLLQLGSRERREIVDYITGKVPVERGTETPDLSTFISTRVVDKRQFGPRVKAITVEHIAPAATPGWPGRITRTLVESLRRNVLEADPKQAKAWLTGLEGIGPEGASKFIASLDEGKLERIGNGYLEQGAVVKRVVHHVLRHATLPLAKGETDEPVTADTKRLIRLPGSLHGKSGLKVVILTRDGLDAFDPLRDAVAFGKDPVVFNPRKDQEATLGGERVAVKAGVPTPVPEMHAVFWSARQGGTVQPKPPENR